MNHRWWDKTRSGKCTSIVVVVGPSHFWIFKKKKKYGKKEKGRKEWIRENE